MRADVLLVNSGLVRTRNRAQELIASGRVFFLTGGQRTPVTKASQQIAEGLSLEVDMREAEPVFVSRGGTKMQGALMHTGIQVKNLSVLDIGISTGGFTDCLLRAGVQSVVGIDVGHGQLAEELKGNSRLKLFEGVNARDLAQIPLVEAAGGRSFDLIVVDVSFISLTLVLPEAIRYLLDGGAVLALVKPQFEVGRDALGKSGIVKNPARHLEVERKLRLSCEKLGLQVEDYFASTIEGGDGNQEYFIYARRN